MDNMTLDLFADTVDSSQVPVQAAAALPEVDFTPILEAAFTDSGRKAAMKTLDPERKAALVAAAGLVSASKRDAYQRAAAGEHLPSFDWLVRQPALASATALLNQHFIDPGAIPMAAL